VRLIPRSLFGRLTLVLLTGLTLTVLLSAGVQMRDRGRILYEAMRQDVIERTVGIVRLLDALPAPQRERLLPILSTSQSQVSLATGPLQMPSDDSDSAAAKLVQRQLRERLGANAKIRVSLSGFVMSGPMTGHPMMGMGNRAAAMMHGLHAMASRFFIQVRLSDGTWVWFERGLPRGLFDWPVKMLLTLGILLVGVTTLSLVAVRWVVRPLADLRRAADALGKDIHRPPLPETGPVEVAETAGAFNRMQQRIGRFVEDRARMLAAVSHDLRTPITRLRLRADLLDDEELAEKIRRDLDEMQAMVEETLDFMRGTDQREATRPIDLMALLDSLIEDAGESGQGVRLEGSVERPYSGRPLALKRCVGNLLNNALRYGGEVEVSVQNSGRSVTLRIADRGPGIPPDAIEKVFEPFFRLEGSRGRDSGGAGLGLGFARNIARAHGGDLLLRNRSEGGLVAELKLPR
jgi:signal transduction histidine kinase